MKLRALGTAYALLAALAGCTAGPGTEAPSVSVRGDGGDGDGDGDRDQDASSGEHAPPDNLGGDDAGADAGPDAGDPGPAIPTEDGVHLSLGGEPFETATDIFYFEAGARPGIQAEFAGASLRVELGRTPGTLRCGDGPIVTYEIEGGVLSAGSEVGTCRIELEAFGENSGDPISATVYARVDRTSGEVADTLSLTARIQVGHP